MTKQSCTGSVAKDALVHTFVLSVCGQPTESENRNSRAACDVVVK